MYLHVFHPVEITDKGKPVHHWDTRNVAIVSEKPDRIDDWALAALRDRWEYGRRKYEAVLYDIYDIVPGMEIVANGYDQATLEVDGPTQRSHVLRP